MTKPLVIDEVVNQPISWLSRKPHEEFILAAKRADRFVFSDAASGLLGRFVIEAGDLVLHHRQFAIPPYDTMYIEFRRPFFEAFPENIFGKAADTAVGYLLVGQRIYIVARSVSQGDKGESSDLLPFYYTWSLPGEKATLDPKTRGRLLVNIGERGNWHKLAVAYGSSQMKITDEDERQMLLDQCQPHLFIDYANRIAPDGLTTQETRDTISTMLMNSAGDVRNVWAALLWLNRPAHTMISNQPAGRRFFRGKQVAYKSHHTVEIDLHKMRSLRRAFVLSGERLSPRRHKVRGAFHHMHGNAGCSHDWPLLPDEDLHWKCNRCGRVRWWVKDHVRGDATRGWVEHDYSVTTGETPENKEQSP
jgi:hypothetical protein